MAEMIRSYVQVSTSKPRSKFRRHLTHLQMCLWDDLVSWPTYSGVFEFDVEERAWYYQVDPADIVAALKLFQAKGKVKVTGTFVWVLDFVDHQSFNPNLRKAAVSELKVLEPRTALASEALGYLSGTLPKPSPIQDDTIQDDTRLSPAAAAPRGTLPSKTPKTAKPQPEIPAEILKLAEQMDKDIKRLEEAGHPMGENWRRRPAQIARSIMRSKVKVTDLADAWAWGLGDNFWQGEMLNQASWEKEPNRWVALVNRYLSRNKKPGQRDAPYAELAR